MDMLEMKHTILKMKNYFKRLNGKLSKTEEAQ